MHLKDFADWYAENTDADYDDIIKQVKILVKNVSKSCYDNGYEKGFDDGCMGRYKWEIVNYETVCNS